MSNDQRQVSTYEFVCASISEWTLQESPWNMGEWHPDGAHFWDNDGLNIVVTQWCSDTHMEIGVYTDAEMDQMDPVTFMRSVENDDVGIFVTGLIAGGARSMLPMKPPVASVTELAARYILQVRQNGPEFMANVANVGRNRGSDYAVRTMQYHQADIAAEIDEAWDGVDIPNEMLQMAAAHAIAVFSDLLDPD